MELITNNPYRQLGLLVGATAKQQTKHIKNIPQFIVAEQEIPTQFTEFGFNFLGEIVRTEKSIEDASSKLDLDADKMVASLFWFYNGNEITDEPAFDALKDYDFETALSIWKKHTESGIVTAKSASAFQNLSNIHLSGIQDGTDLPEHILKKGIALKLRFLESEFVIPFKTMATDVTYKTTHKELQIIFLNKIAEDVETRKRITIAQLFEILSNEKFVAKEDFLKEFVEKSIQQIEKLISETKVKRKSNKALARTIGIELHRNTKAELAQVKSILGASNLKFTSISDKLAEAILQCSIDYFNDCQEKDIDNEYFDSAIKLAKSAESIAVGNLIKERIKESINTIKEKKDGDILKAIELLQSIKDAFETNKARINREVRAMPLGYNQSINWTKVNEMIEKSIDWDQVVELIQKVIPFKNIDKIKKMQDVTKLNEYKSLVNFLLGKLNYTNKNKVKYINYWETAKVTTNTSSSSSNPQSDFSFYDNAFWIFGVIGIIIGLSLGFGWGCLITGVIGLGIGVKINE